MVHTHGSYPLCMPTTTAAAATTVIVPVVAPCFLLLLFPDRWPHFRQNYGTREGYFLVVILPSSLLPSLAFSRLLRYRMAACLWFTFICMYFFFIF